MEVPSCATVSVSQSECSHAWSSSYSRLPRGMAWAMVWLQELTKAAACTKAAEGSVIEQATSRSAHWGVEVPSCAAVSLIERAHACTRAAEASAIVLAASLSAQ